MRALVWHGTQDIRCDTVPDPEIEDGRDAIIKVTSCAICGSDLHLYDHYIPAMKSGDIWATRAWAKWSRSAPRTRS
jgi:threonine dehydrogenase-like Zn-dependent dehydrogenase